jgi:hypothetical protein
MSVDLEGFALIAAHGLRVGDRIAPGYPVLSADLPDIVTDVIDRQDLGYIRVVADDAMGQPVVHDYSTMEDVLIHER